MNYGFIDNVTPKESETAPPAQPENAKRKAPQEPSKLN